MVNVDPLGDWYRVPLDFGHVGLSAADELDVGADDVPVDVTVLLDVEDEVDEDCATKIGPATTLFGLALLSFDLR